MFELDHDLAQDIVDRAMAILPCNVNVMDSQGLILGSGEPERINTRHEGRNWFWPTAGSSSWMSRQPNV